MRSSFVASLLAFTLVACSGASSAPLLDPAAEAPVAPAGEAPAETPTAPTPAAGYVPGAEWETVEPTAAGWDPAKLEELAAYAGSRSTKSLVVLSGGRLVMERHFDGADATFTRDIASAQKSVLSVLAGVAIDKGLVGLDDSVSGILGAGWSNVASPPQEAAITVRHLLTMTSGLDESLGYAAPAGSAWLYNNDAYYRVRLVLEKKTGKGIDAIAHEWLFDRVGMTGSAFAPRLDKDAKGLAVLGLKSTARDLARFGLMLERRGAWGDQAIVSPGYVDVATSTSQPHNASYGFLFWLNGKPGGLLPPSTPFTGALVPSAPTDMFAALGAADQKVYVARSLEVVLTRLGSAAGETKNALSSFDEELWRRLVAARM